MAGAGIVRWVVAASFAVSSKVPQELEKEIYCRVMLCGLPKYRGPHFRKGAPTSSYGIFLYAQVQGRGGCRLRCMAVRKCWGHPISIPVWMVTETFSNLHPPNRESLIVSVILAAELQLVLIIRSQDSVYQAALQ